jgi:outer membrane protein insertion porin family
LAANKRGFVLTVTIDEGDIYTIENVEIKSHIDKIDPKSLDVKYYCKKGDRYNIVLLDADLANLIKAISNKGRTAVKVFPEIRKDPVRKTISVTYHILETSKVYISKIVIKGNHRTRDHVIRREIPLHEGDVLSDTLLSTAENNIRGLGFFKSVKVDTVEDANSPDKCVIQVEVDEQSTGEVVVAASYTTGSGFGMDLSYNERNFYGTGKSFGISIGSGKMYTGKSYRKNSDGTEERVARKSKFKFANSVVVSAADPHLFDKDMEGSASVYRYSTSRFSSFTAREMGTTLGVSYDLTPKLQQGFDYTLSNRKYNDVYPFASPIIKNQVLCRNKDGTLSNVRPGKSNLSSLKHSINYTTAFLTGLKGSVRTGLGTTVAGLGGNAKHIKNELYGTYVMTLWRSSTLRFSASYGVLNRIGKNAPHVGDSFNLGLDSFRGFDDCGLGPRAETVRQLYTKDGTPAVHTLPLVNTPLLDPKTGKVIPLRQSDSEYIGASKYWKGTVEYKFPLGLPEELQFKGFVFTDFGTAWGAPDKGKKMFSTTKLPDGTDEITCELDRNRTTSYYSTYGKVISHKILDRRKIRQSIGFGLSLITPFGPLVFTYALPIRKEKYDEQQRFLIGFSTTF